MKTYRSYETERLIIQPTSINDAPFIYELMNTPKWILNIGNRKITTIKVAEEYIKVKMLPQLEKLGYGNYTIIRKSDNIKLGTSGLFNREGLEGLDIGFAFLPKHEKKGYAFEASQKIMRGAIDHFGVTNIKGITLPSNLPSQHLLEKLGLTFQKMITLPDDEDELMLYQWTL